MESDPLLFDSLALKGGTAINLTIFDLPRLSVDIDMDFAKNMPREAMLKERELINEHICKYMTASRYNLSPKSKQYHALDSFVYEYVNAGGMKDNLKIEINYMLRCHVFLQKYELFDESQEAMFKKCILFYSAIASETVPEHFDFGGIGKISPQKIKTDLTPVLRSAEHFDLSAAQGQVDKYLKGILLPEGDLSFWTTFAKGEYDPSLLFDDPELLLRIERHPMALWKCSKKLSHRI